MAGKKKVKGTTGEPTIVINNDVDEGTTVNRL